MLGEPGGGLTEGGGGSGAQYRGVLRADIWIWILF